VSSYHDHYHDGVLCTDKRCRGDTKQPEWELDSDRCWNLRVGHVHVWLQPRPTYCDRGHWIGNVMGIATIDSADAFPRYYMSLERAKAEMAEWLEWRLLSER
jgi:hypothetical protein